MIAQFVIGANEDERMSKAAEEGEIWEWRAFGRLPKALSKQVKLHPFRLDQTGFPLANLVGQDLYLISPVSSHNIKLRKSFGGAWLLKFKLLLGTEARLIELYHESEKKSFRFPLTPGVVRETAQLLAVTLPQRSEAEWASESFSEEKFLSTMVLATPPIRQVRVGKIRSQYEMGEGWIELADVTFPQQQTQSISLHGFRRETVEAMLDTLFDTNQLDVMNYLQACQKWG